MLNDSQKARILIVGNMPSTGSDYISVSAELADRLEQRRVSRPANLRWEGWLPRLLDHFYTIVRHCATTTWPMWTFSAGGAFALTEAACYPMKCLGKRYMLTLHGGNLPDFARQWPNRVRRLLQSGGGGHFAVALLAEEMRPIATTSRSFPTHWTWAAMSSARRTRIAPRLVWLRAFDETYNPSMAAQVVAMLAPHASDVHLTMFGPERKAGVLATCQAIAAQLDVANRIEFPGSVPKPQIPERLQTGDIFLNTTNFDNTPVSVLEAMACGLCVVSTNVGGLPYLLQSEHDSLLVPPRDPEAMAAAVRRVLTEPGLAGRLSANAKKRQNNSIGRWS